MRYQRHLVSAIVTSLLCVLCIPAGAQTQQTQDGQQPPKAQLGATLRDMHPRGSPAKTPVRIAYVYPDSAAEKAGLHQGDVVMSMDGVAADGTTALVASIRKHAAGDKVQLIVMSGSAAPRPVEVTLGPVKDFGPTFPAGECLYGYGTLDALYAKGPDPRAIFVHNDAVFVYQIMPGSDLARAGVVAQDQILAIDGLKITSIDTLYQKVLPSYAPGESIRLKYAHQGRTKEVSVPLGCLAWPPGQESETKIWSEMKDKPPLPDIVDREWVLAENSLGEKDLFAAWCHYMKGLAAFPFWPQGWYNSAMIAKEMLWWGPAAEEMKKYLRLVPNAPDAQAARDEIIIWEEKAKEASVPMSAQK